MRIKYLGAKVSVILVTALATPVVWAALAWPEWQSAAPPEFAVETAQAVAPVPTQEVPAAIPQVIRQVIVVPRYVVVEATAASSGLPSPAGTAPPLPTPVPIVVPQQRAEPAPQPTQKPAAASGSGSSGATAKQSTGSSSSSNQASSQGSQSSSSQSTTRGS